MFCPNCGVENDDSSEDCRNCQRSLGSLNVVEDAPEFPYVGFGRRFVAWIIDSVLLNVSNFIITTLLGLAGLPPPIQLVIAIVISWIYYAGLESSSSQATLGKMVMKVYVTDLDGHRIGFAQATGRYFGKILSGFILGIGYLMIAFTERHQGLHDKIVGTYVLQRGSASSRMRDHIEQ